MSLLQKPVILKLILQKTKSATQKQEYKMPLSELQLSKTDFISDYIQIQFSLYKQTCSH